MTGIDATAWMLELARRRLSADRDPRVVDLASPLPFPDDAFDDAFDDVIASLVPHSEGLGTDAGRAATRAEA